MITHYLQTAWRHYVRFKYSTIANILCLSFGMTCFLCAYSVFAYFASAESGFSKSGNIYVIVTTIKKGAEDPMVVAGIPPAMIKYIKAEIPDLHSISFTSNLLGTKPRKVRVGDKTIDWFRSISADKNFLTLLDLPMISGNRETSLSLPNSMVIGADAAIKLFGTADVIGKTVHFDEGVDVTITGVLGPLPIPTHLAMIGNQGADGKHYLDALIPWQVEEQLMMNDAAAHSHIAASELSFSFEQLLDATPLPMGMAYINLPTNSDVKALDSKLAEMIQRHFSGKLAIIDEDPVHYAVSVVPVKQVLSTFVDSTATILGMPLKQLMVFCGVIVLCVAIINYANMYTTQLISCRNELRVQRLLGATKMQLAIQCVLETVLISLAALALALLFFEPLKVPINDNSFVEFNIQWLSGWHYWLVLTSLVVVVSLLAALYPVVHLARTISTKTSRGGVGWVPARSAMHALVAAQFSIAGTLLILILVAGEQNSELKRLALAHLDDPVVVIKNNLEQNHVAYQVLAETLRQYPQVKSVTAAKGTLWSQGFGFEPSSVSSQQGSTATRHRVDVENISFGFLNTMNMKLLEGRDFDRSRDKTATEIPAESSGSSIANIITPVIVDKSLVAALGYKNISGIINTELYGHGGDFIGIDMHHLRIIGVVEDTYLAMMGTHNVGSVFILGKDNATPLVRIDKQDIQGGLQAIDTVWKQLAPNAPINRKFLKEQYTTPAFIARAFWVLSFLLILAITISLLGMIGITLHTLTRRTHEISIRKSLGASSTDILNLLLSFFAKPVVIANILLAWPLGYLISRAYLSLFPYRVALTIWPFVISLLITLAIVCIAVGTQSLQAARRKPAEVLRYE